MWTFDEALQTISGLSTPRANDRALLKNGSDLKEEGRRAPPQLLR
jgi:hypothetical protein